jgi:polysaccharide pyruvyl transferase WcaK-like protein
MQTDHFELMIVSGTWFLRSAYNYVIITYIYIVYILAKFYDADSCPRRMES